MTFEEIFSSSTTYQIVLGLIPIILTEFIKSDYNEKNFKNSFFRTTNFIIPIGIIIWVIIENKNFETLNVYNILIVVFNFSIFLFNYFQSKIKETTHIAWKTTINNSKSKDAKTLEDGKESITCYDFTLNFDCTTAFYEQIKNHDFSKTIPQTDSNLKLLAKTEQANNNVINSNDKPIISKLEERKFEIVYYELKQD